MMRSAEKPKAADHRINIDGIVMEKQKTAADSPKVWATLISNTEYLPGLFVLNHTLKRVNSRYPLVALCASPLPSSAHAAIEARGIARRQVDKLVPKVHRDFTNEPRFRETWTKLVSFGLDEYERVVLLDSDMLVLKNMDELMELELDGNELEGKGERVFAASHACTCNPARKPHYPKSWIPENCAFTHQHSEPEGAQENGAPSTTGLGLLNSGLLVINPSTHVLSMILAQLETDAVLSYDFPDQDLLADLFRARWVALPYVYNALKTLRWKEVHAPIWRDDRVKTIHYILGPKPWNEEPGNHTDETHAWWWDANRERVEYERQNGIRDDI